MQKNRILFYILFSVLALTGCAKRGSITGGPKDTIAPILVNSSPRNMTTNFTGDEIRINFNEYIKIKDVNKQLIISPPMETPPLITPMGSASDYIKIKIKDTLQPNTTYSFNFGQSITDNNEGNPFSQFRFVFSTGSYIDSLNLGGKIKDAFSRETDNFVTVMLYEENETYNDSTVYNERPRYVTNTLDSAKIWALQNLKEGRYRLFAIKDANNNYKYDPKSDKIAFLNQTITVPNDTLYQLELFREKQSYRAKKPSQISSNRLVAGYEGTIKPKELKFSVADAVTGEAIRAVVTDFKDKDSVNVWLPRGITADSLKVNVAYRDSIKDYNVRWKEMKATDSLSLDPVQKGSIHFREKFAIRSITPLTTIDSTKISLVGKDSTNVAYKYVYDDFKQELQFDFEKEENQKYTFTFLPGAVRDFYEKENDTLSFNLNTRKAADYGNIFLTLTDVARFPVIIQLTDNKGETVEEYYSKGETRIIFMNMIPGDYFIRAIYDDNANGEWDTGNYLEKRQPEQVIYRTKPASLHATWDMEETFSIGAGGG